MLLRSMSKSHFVKNAYFTAPMNGGCASALARSDARWRRMAGGKDKPANQHFLDVFLGQVAIIVLRARMLAR
jgi:hypothetical protein